MEAKRANEHYKTGWESMRREAWDDAAKEFQAAIDSDDRFTLAYYSLGRAEMGAPQLHEGHRRLCQMPRAVH